MRGVDVTFPFVPYACQLVYMEKMIEALQCAGNALLESPTGTGKVRLCNGMATIAFEQATGRRHISRYPAAKFTRTLASQTLCVLCSALGWQQAYLAALQHQHASARLGSLPRPNDLNDDAVKRIMNAAGVIIEPTLPAASREGGFVLQVAGRKYAQSDGRVEVAMEGAPSPSTPRAPKIIFASRTHSQLSQVVRELKSCGYTPRIAVLGGRDQLCVHTGVSKLSSSAQVHACRSLVRSRRCAPKLALTEWLERGGDMSNMDTFRTSIGGNDAATGAGAAAPPRQSGSVLDIEELGALGRERGMCTYFLPRDAAVQREADLLLVPYAYLVDPAVRAQTFDKSFDWRGSVVVFDEGHNVEDTASDAASFDLSAADVARCIDELERAIAPFVRGGPDANAFVEEDVAVAGFKPGDAFTLRTILLALEKAIDELPLDSPAGSNGVTIAIGGQNARVEPGEFIYSFLGKFNFKYETKGVCVELIDAIVTFLAGRDAIAGSTGSSRGKFALEGLRTTFDRIFRSEATAAETAKFYRVVIHTPPPHGATSSGGGLGRSGRTLSYWCFSPGVVMAELKALGVRSVIITSGTLAPLDSYAAELRLPFPIRLENPHVVPPSQVFAAVLARGIMGSELLSTRAKDTPEYKRDLGATIASLLRRIPDGTLVFFSSYGAMERTVEFWRKDAGGAIWRRLESCKAPFIEPRAGADFGEVLRSYNTAVAAGGGAVLFAVCRGKLSEGIDFADAAGRAVIVTGVPFAPPEDPRVVLKRRYLDEECRSQGAGGVSLTGGAWYEQQAYRAVNQALGRVIRNARDYGAILLLDARFARRESLANLSKWLRPQVRTNFDVPQVEHALTTFFRENASVAGSARLQELERERSARQRAAAAASAAAQQRAAAANAAAKQEAAVAQSVAQRVASAAVKPPRTVFASAEGSGAAPQVDLYAALANPRTAPVHRDGAMDATLRTADSAASSRLSSSYARRNEDDAIKRIVDSDVAQPATLPTLTFGLQRAMKTATGASTSQNTEPRAASGATLASTQLEAQHRVEGATAGVTTAAASGDTVRATDSASARNAVASSITAPSMSSKSGDSTSGPTTSSVLAAAPQTIESEQKAALHSSAQLYMKEVKAALGSSGSAYADFLLALRKFRESAAAGPITPTVSASLAERIAIIFGVTSNNGDTAPSKTRELLLAFVQFVPADHKSQFKQYMSRIVGEITSDASGNGNDTAVLGGAAKLQSVPAGTTQRATRAALPLHLPRTLQPPPAHPAVDLVTGQPVVPARATVQRASTTLPLARSTGTSTPHEVAAAPQVAHITSPPSSKRPRLESPPTLNLHGASDSKHAAAPSSLPSAPLRITTATTNAVAAPPSGNFGRLSAAPDVEQRDRGGLTCVVCLESCETMQSAPCGHVACARCWACVLELKHACPVCRRFTLPKFLVTLFLN